jgi:hypothetical protein
MEPNGKGMTEQDLKDLPQSGPVVLWQPDDDGPISAIDSDGQAWMVGFYQGRLCKSRMGSYGYLVL